jgi:Fe-S cluster assembly protein SufD
MDDEQIFYLQARGINEQAARGILLYAFAAASLEAVKPQALRSHLLDLLFDRLPCGAELREAL